ncbi:MAG: hypothetical protein WCS96_11325 [Victivallales bacterium]|jgi:hypothetical protein
MSILLNHKPVNITLSEDISVNEVIRCLELSLCRELRGPLTASVNEKIVVEKAWHFIKIGDADILDICESPAGTGCQSKNVVLNTHSKYDMTKSAHMRKGLLSEDVIGEYRNKIKKR